MRKPHDLYKRLITAPRVIRVLIGILLVIGGLFAFLPVLGVWMIPLGIVVIFFERPWVRRNWQSARQHWKAWRQRRAEARAKGSDSRD